MFLDPVLKMAFFFSFFFSLSPSVSDIVQFFTFKYIWYQGLFDQSPCNSWKHIWVWINIAENSCRTVVALWSDLMFFHDTQRAKYWHPDHPLKVKPVEVQWPPVTWHSLYQFMPFVSFKLFIFGFVTGFKFTVQVHHEQISGGTRNCQTHQMWLFVFTHYHPGDVCIPLCGKFTQEINAWLFVLFKFVGKAINPLFF